MTGKDDVEELLRIVRRIIDRETADGCIGCVHFQHEEWELPCSKWQAAHTISGQAKKRREDDGADQQAAVDTV